MRYGEFQFEKSCHTKGVILSNEEGDSFVPINNPKLDEYSFINKRTKEVLTVTLIVVEEKQS